MTSKHLGRIASIAATVVLSVGVAATGGAVATASPTDQSASTSRLGFPTDTMEHYMRASVADVDATWVRLFAGWGYQTVPSAQVVFPLAGQTYFSCGKNSDDTTMQYCFTDDTITFSQEAATQMWEGTYNHQQVANNGAMSVSLMLAHEYGHNIENELGLGGDSSTHDAAMRERGADCFAGVWAQDAADRGLLSATDVAAAYAALDVAAEHPEINISDGIHGTPEERQQAYEIGANQGARACVVTYLSNQAGSTTQVTQQDPTQVG